MREHGPVVEPVETERKYSSPLEKLLVETTSESVPSQRALTAILANLFPEIKEGGIPAGDLETLQVCCDLLLENSANAGPGAATTIADLIDQSPYLKSRVAFPIDELVASMRGMTALLGLFDRVDAGDIEPNSYQLTDVELDALYRHDEVASRFPCVFERQEGGNSIIMRAKDFVRQRPESTRRKDLAYRYRCAESDIAFSMDQCRKGTRVFLGQYILDSDGVDVGIPELIIGTVEVKKSFSRSAKKLKETNNKVEIKFAGTIVYTDFPNDDFGHGLEEVLVVRLQPGCDNVFVYTHTRTQPKFIGTPTRINYCIGFDAANLNGLSFGKFPETVRCVSVSSSNTLTFPIQIDVSSGLEELFVPLERDIPTSPSNPYTSVRKISVTFNVPRGRGFENAKAVFESYPNLASLRVSRLPEKGIQIGPDNLRELESDWIGEIPEDLIFPPSLKRLGLPLVSAMPRGLALPNGLLDLDIGLVQAIPKGYPFPFTLRRMTVFNRALLIGCVLPPNVEIIETNPS